MDVIVRPAVAADLPLAAAIYGSIDAALDSRLHPLLRTPDLDAAARARAALADLVLVSEEDPSQVWIAAVAGDIVGFASAAFRERHAHIQYLFVDPQTQERGIGGMLLDRLRAAAQNAGCTVFTLQASDDPRALTRYLRFGLFPLAPNLVWSAPRPTFPAPRLDNPFEAVPLTSENEATLNTVGDIDKAVRGVRRQRDLVRWLSAGESGALLIDRLLGRPAGYYVVSLGDEHARIGPVAAMDRERFGEVLASALTAAGALHRPGKTWKLAMPGENQAAVAPLLAAGFRPDYATTFFASEPIGRFDRYVFHDLDLL